MEGRRKRERSIKVRGWLIGFLIALEEPVLLEYPRTVTFNATGDAPLSQTYGPSCPGIFL